MQANGVCGAQLAIAKSGVTKFSRAYTWAEAGYRTTQPSDRFLLASCSKMFLEAAVQALYDAKKLTPDTKVYPLLGFSHPADPRSDPITIQQLLDHMRGYNDDPSAKGGSGFDPTYSMRQIALDLNLGQPSRWDRGATPRDRATAGNPFEDKKGSDGQRVDSVLLCEVAGWSRESGYERQKSPRIYAGRVWSAIVRFLFT